MFAKMSERGAGLARRAVLRCANEIKRSRQTAPRETLMSSMRLFAGALCLFASTAAFANDPLPRAKPEEVGISSERLDRIESVMTADGDAGRIPGAVIAIARRGTRVKLNPYGFRDKAANVAMTTETIFNDA